VARTGIVSLFCGVLAACVPLGALADATSIGALFAFGLVNIAVIVLRRKRPDMPRTFRVAFSPVAPTIGFGLCVWMMGSFDAITWEYFLGWMAVGLVVYFAYGLRRSQPAREEK
jgi:APA family basic amino acid/polyamine antiporter